MVQQYGDDSSDEEIYDEESDNEERQNDKRVILHLDADCYEYQVWMKKKYPELEGENVPAVVVNPDGIMLAVNYPARKRGIDRKQGRKALEDAKALCPELLVITAGVKEGVIDTDTPLEESDKIIRVLQRYRNTLALRNRKNFIIEMSSRDEFYLDVTGLVSSRMRGTYRKEQAGGRFIKGCALPSQKDINELTEAQKTFPDDRFAGNPVVIMDGRQDTITKSTLNFRVRKTYSDNLEDYHYDEARLVFGAIIAKTLMKEIQRFAGYNISVGVGHNKLKAKMACSRNKPEGITILTDAAVPRLVKKLQFQDLPGFQNAIGEKLREEYKRETGKKLATLRDVQCVSLDRLEQLLKAVKVPMAESRAFELYQKSQLIDDEPVRNRYYANTVRQTMSFKWNHAVDSEWEFYERLQALGRLFENKVSYRVKAHRRLATQCCIKVELKKKARNKISGGVNTMDLRQSWDDKSIYTFVRKYIEANKIKYGDVAQIVLTGSKLEWHCVNVY